MIGITGWRFKPGGGPNASFKAHPGGVESVAFSPDGKTLASGGWDRHVKLWDIASNPESPRLIWDFTGFGDGVRSVAFSPDGSNIAAGGFDRVLIVLEARDGRRAWTSPRSTSRSTASSSRPTGDRWRWRWATIPGAPPAIRSASRARSSSGPGPAESDWPG